MYVSFNVRWFWPETIKHDLMDSMIEIVVSGTGNGNQVPSCPYELDINYNNVGLISMEHSVKDSMQWIGKQTKALVLKLELLQMNIASLP
jgi:hypothetical protein